MPNMKKQPGDAVLSRDGTVRVNGVKVGYWTYEPRDIMPWATYSFSFEKRGPVVWDCYGKDTFKHHVPLFLEAFNQGKKYE